MSRPTTQAPTAITIGTRLTDFGTLDLTVEGMASGGMGLVVWGKNTARGNEMTALKLLKPERLSAAAIHSLEQRRIIEHQFEEEALVWCHLWYHTCVVAANGLTRLHTLGDLPVLSLVYSPNGSLRDLIRRSREEHSQPPLRAALAWGIHIASALAHIHQPDPAHDRPNPLVHCDLKPENVLLNEYGWAQLTDLGLTRAYAVLAAEPVRPPVTKTASHAAAVGGPTAHQAEVARLRAILQVAGALPSAATAGSAPALSVGSTVALLTTHTLRIPSTPGLAQTTRVTPISPPVVEVAADPAAAPPAIGARGPVAGTPQYMAPEQWEGINATLPATDVYAFGVLLYELFAGSEAPHPFPHDPAPYLTADLYAYAVATGYDPHVLAWHAAHTSASGPAHRLNDPQAAEAALRTGPLAELAARGDAAGSVAANEALQQLDALIMECLSRDPAARPSAATVQQQLDALVLDPCDLELVPAPVPMPTTPQFEVEFWRNLGATYGNLGHYEHAITAQRRAIMHDPTDFLNWNNLGYLLNVQGDQERLLAARAAADGQPDAIVTAHVASSRQHFEDALAVFQQAEFHLASRSAAKVSTAPAMIATNQGLSLTYLGRYGEAVAAFRRVLALQADDVKALVGLALTHAHWSQAPDITSAERIAHLHVAQREIQGALAATPNYNGARALADDIARAIADPEYRFQG